MSHTIKNYLPASIKTALRPYYRRLFPHIPPVFDDEIGDLPKSLTFYTNLKCLAACPHCCLIQDNPEVFHGNTFMSDELFYSIINAPSSRAVKTLVFAGGEALQHPQLFDWCREGQKRGMNVQVISNGMSLSYDHIVERVLTDAPFNNLQISLDAINEADYVAAKGLKKAPFEKICENLRRIATYYKEHPKIKVVTSYVITGSNIDKAEKMVELSGSLNTDVVVFHTMQLASNASWKQLGDSLFAFPPEFHAIMLRTDYPFTIQLQPPLQSEFLQNYCTSLENHLVIGPDGALAPCCHRAWNAEHGNFKTSSEPHNISSRVEMRRKFIEAERFNDASLLHENCKMCNRRLKGVYRFEPVSQKWDFLPVEVNE